GDALEQIDGPDAAVKCLHDALKKIPATSTAGDTDYRPQIWQVSLNRKALPALERSVPAVKGDAARTLFRVKCDKINWAVLDSGIDASHPVFFDRNGKSRIRQAFDFSNIRQIV